MPSAEQVQVQVVDGLAALFPGVDDYAIAVVQLAGAGDVGSGGHQMAQQRSVFGGGLCLRGNVLFGNDQQMSWGLGIDIGETDATLVFINTIRGDLSLNNFAEQTIGRHG